MIYVMDLLTLPVCLFFFNLLFYENKYLLIRYFRNKSSEVSNFISAIDIYFWLVLISSTDNDGDRCQNIERVSIL